MASAGFSFGAGGRQEGVDVLGDHRVQAGRVGTAQRVDQELVLLGHVMRAGVTGCVPPEVGAHPGLHRPPQLQAVVLARPDEHVLVEADVGVRERVGVAALTCFSHVFDELAEHSEVVVGQLGCCAGERVALDDDPDGNQNLLDLLLRHLRDDRSAVRVADDQAFLLELAQCVAYRLLARAQLPGELELDRKSVV